MRVFYCDEMFADIGSHTSPSSRKPKLMALALQGSDLPVEFVRPQEVSIEDLCRAHEPEFVRDILSCKRSNGFGNSMPAVATSLPWTSGSMLSGAKSAIDGGRITASLSSGFHHAGYKYAGAFCTFNGLMVTALTLRAAGIVRRIAIVDCDMHYGDGTDDIIGRLKMHDILHYTAGKYFNSSKQGAEYLARLKMEMRQIVSFGAEIILYQAGADVHVDDPLGGVLTAAQMLERDEIVLGAAITAKVPVCFNLAGGYQRDASDGITPVIDLHMQTFAVGCRLLGEGVRPKQ